MSDEPQTRDELLAEVQELLGTPYEHAKRAHIWAEEESGEHNWLAMTNFRDALDHMAKIFRKLDENDLDGARKNLGEMEAHINRAAYDSAQSAVEQRLERVMDRRRSDFIYQFTFVEHMSDEDFFKRKDKVSSRMSKGREMKAEGLEESLRHFVTANEHAKEMDRGTPGDLEVGLHLIIIIGVLVTIGVAVISLF